MPKSSSLRLGESKKRIMDIWAERALQEVSAAGHQENLALRNSLPEYLTQLENLLSSTTNRTHARKLYEKEESSRVGKKHGRERAGSRNYTMDQLIFEYHLLRRIIFDVLEEDTLLTDVEREVIVCSVEQQVNDAATEYSDTLKEIQEQLTNTLAHDFRTPLSVAKMNFELILRDQQNSQQIIHRAARGISSLNRLDKLIQDLLDSSRMKSGMKLVLEFDDNCDLNGIIQEVISDLGSTQSNKYIFSSPGSCIGHWSDVGLRRVLENLITNAVKYGDPGTPITIELSQENDEVTFSVHNRGEPIPEDEIGILFQQYRRLRGTEEKRGWGLGLNIVKGLVDAHEGRVKVESEAEKGTVFYVTIPRNPVS